jgi:16S rRNA (cytosine967-C5)-methyltransferase
MAIVSAMSEAKAAPEPSVARELALGALQGVRAGRGFVHEVLDELIERHRPTQTDAHLGTELATGAVRWRLTLRALARPFFRGQWSRLQPIVADALLLGTYQIWMLDRIPPHAAVGQVVELVKVRKGPRAAGLVNGVLRSMLRELSAERVPMDHLDDGPTTLWRDEPTGLRFNRSVWPDPADNPIEHLALTTSNPPRLVRRFVETFGLPTARAICRAGQHRPPLSLRANAARCSVEQVRQALADEGMPCEMHEQPGILVAASSRSVWSMQAFQRGLFQPQDATAARAVAAAALRPGERVLDLCAAPGGKATQAAELMGDEGVVIACDVSEGRLALVRANANRLGLRSIRYALASRLDAALAETGPPNLVVVDVPCSNTGVLSRRPEARYRFSPKTMAKLVEQQVELLSRAASLAGRPGRVLYSTCSIDPSENEGPVGQLLRGHRDWRLVGAELTLPTAGPERNRWRDGGYWALLAVGR